MKLACVHMCACACACVHAQPNKIFDQKKFFSPKNYWTKKKICLKKPKKHQLC